MNKIEELEMSIEKLTKEQEVIKNSLQETIAVMGDLAISIKNIAEANAVKQLIDNVYKLSESVESLANVVETHEYWISDYKRNHCINVAMVDDDDNKN